MKPLLTLIALVVGIPVVGIAVLLIAYFAEVPIPVSRDQLTDDVYFRSLVDQGDQLIGGGYSFAEANDVWIRVRLPQEPDFDAISVAERCSPKALETLRTWFLDQAAASQKILGILPISRGAQADEMALNDLPNLYCLSTEDFAPITHRLGEYPQGCSSVWVLYHKPSRFYYERSPCSH